MSRLSASTARGARLVIRPAAERDARALSALIRKNADALLARRYSARRLAAWKRYNTPARIRRRIAERAMFCAFRGRRLCATAALAGTEVQGLYVNPRYCGQGIGRRLLAHLEDFAACQGIAALHLTSTPDAVAFYAGNGWRVGRTVVVVVLGVPFEETRMTKRLNRGRRKKSP
jgi:GNAT superfamily N-acetyltransferase